MQAEEEDRTGHVQKTQNQPAIHPVLLRRQDEAGAWKDGLPEYPERKQRSKRYEKAGVQPLSSQL